MNKCDESNNKNSLPLNNNFEMDKHTGCSSKNIEERPSEEFHNFNACEEGDSDDNPAVNLSDSYEDDLPVSDDDDDVQLSSPSNSLNSDIDQRWFGQRWGAGNNMIDDNHNNHLNIRQLDNQIPPQPQQQEEEETDFLEMDFEPDTNSEIENEATLPHPNQSNLNSFNFQLPQPDFRLVHPLPNGSAVLADESESLLPLPPRNTGAKPKQNNRIQKQTVSRRATDGDNIFKITINNNHIDTLTSQCHPSSFSSSSATKRDDIYNLGASSSRTGDRLPLSFDKDPSGFLKIHKSPAKSSTHQHTHKQQRVHEEQNDQFLFEIEPLKPRNSVTIYTTNCDDKILIDALTSLNLEPNRELIAAYFNRSKPSTGTGTASNCELNLSDFIIYRSKLNCNYMKLIELIQKACKSDDDESYSADNKFDINFYPLDLFSTAPEMIEVLTSEIVARWTPLTDLSPLINIRNKYFYQTNVLGKIVNIIRKMNQTPPATFKDKETIKIPQFYNSGYITITMTNHKFKPS